MSVSFSYHFILFPVSSNSRRVATAFRINQDLFLTGTISSTDATLMRAVSRQYDTRFLVNWDAASSQSKCAGTQSEQKELEYDKTWR